MGFIGFLGFSVRFEILLGLEVSVFMGVALGSSRRDTAQVAR